MISAGEVGAVFKVADEATPVINRLVAQFNELDVAINRAKLAMTELRLPRGLATRITEVAKGVKSIGDGAGTAATEFNAGMVRIDESAKATTAVVAELKREIASLGKVPTGALGGAPAGVRARAAGASGAGGRAAALGEPGYAGIPAGPVAAGSEGGLLGGVAAIAYGAWEAVKASADLQAVQENLKISGVSVDEIKRATKQAYDIGEKFGLTARDVLKTADETRNPLNKGRSADEGLEAAMRHAETLARAQVVLRNQGGEHGGDDGKDLYDLVKAAEFRNAISDNDFDKAIDSMVKADRATGGIVNPRAWIQMSQMLKGALPGLSDKYLYEIMPELAQEFKGAPAGTAATSLYQQLIAGQMRTTGIRLLDDLGMVDRDKVEYDKAGRIVRMKPGAYRDSDAFKSDPLKGMADLIAAMDAHGIKDAGSQRDYLSQIFANRNAAQMAMTLAYQYGRLNRGAAGIENTWGLVPASNELLQNNSLDQWHKLTSSFTNLGAVLGGGIMPTVTGALNFVTDRLNADRKLYGTLIPGAEAAREKAFNVPDEAGLSKLWRWLQTNVSVGQDAAYANFADRSLVKNGYGHWWSGPGASVAAEERLESSRAKALSNVQVAAPNVETQVNVKVYVNGVPTAASIEREIVQRFRTNNSSIGFDPRAGESYPDQYGHH